MRSDRRSQIGDFRLIAGYNSHFPEFQTPTTMSLNAQYLSYLAQYPLLTKSITAGVFAALNELIASGIAGDFQTTKINLFGCKKTIKHVLSPKVLLMVVYGAFLATPISHKLYGVLNKVFAGKLSPGMKLLQILASLCTVTPTLSAIYVAWLSVINGYRPQSCEIKKEACRAIQVMKYGLKKNYGLVLRTSAVTTAIAVTFAQKFLAPELWVVFFSFVAFVVGTVQNTRLKLRLKAADQDKKDQ